MNAISLVETVVLYCAVTANASSEYLELSRISFLSRFAFGSDVGGSLRRLRS